MSGPTLPADATDDALLERVVDYVLTERQTEAFAEMRDHVDAGRRLSPAQRAWIRSVIKANEPTYKNEFSAGLVPRGADVPTPPALQNLPKKPPHRRNEP